jgi:hypothetical protein
VTADAAETAPAPISQPFRTLLCFRRSLQKVYRWRRESDPLDYDLPTERLRLEYFTRAEEARIRGAEATDPKIRDWWVNAADAWEYLADHPKRRP